MKPILLSLIFISYLFGQNPIIVSGGGGGGSSSGSGTSRTWNYSFQGTYYGGVPVFSGNIPVANAPTAIVNSGAALAVLNFTQGVSDQYWYGDWQIPPNFTGAISYRIFSLCNPALCDSTNTTNVYISLACNGYSTEFDIPSFVELTAPIAIINNASGYIKLTTGSITPGVGTPTLPTCASTDFMSIKLRADTTNLTTGYSFQLAGVTFLLQGTF